MDPHYKQHHYRKPHEALVSGINPPAQHVTTEKNHTAYIWLYVFLAVGLVILCVLALGMWLDCRRKDEEEEEWQKQNKGKRLQRGENQLYPSAGLCPGNIYPNPEIEEKSSLFEGSVTTTTTEIQPKAPPMSYEKMDEMSQKSSSFGTVNVHRQQSIASSSDLGMHSSTHQFPPPLSYGSTTANTSSISLGGNSKRMSKMESFPYEEYGIPENERQPIKTRVQDLKTYDHFLHLTPIDPDLLREDSIVEDDEYHDHDENGTKEDANFRSGRFESQATLPRASIDKSTSSYSGP